MVLQSQSSDDRWQTLQRIAQQHSRCPQFDARRFGRIQLSGRQSVYRICRFGSDSSRKWVIIHRLSLTRRTLMTGLIGVFVPPECNDSPYFANCDLIVNAKYCNNPHYAKFCCRSCLLAGQLDPSTLLAWATRRSVPVSPSQSRPTHSNPCLAGHLIIPIHRSFH